MSTDRKVLDRSHEWTIAKCEKETGHKQVKNSHFCRCTHVMFDSEKVGASRMPAMDSITEADRRSRAYAITGEDITIAKLRYLLYEAIMELQYVQDAEDHSQCASAKAKQIIEKGMELLQHSNLGTIL